MLRFFGFVVVVSIAASTAPLTPPRSLPARQLQPRPPAPVRVNETLLPSDLNVLHERRWKVFYRRRVGQMAPPSDDADFVVEEVPTYHDSSSVKIFSLVARVTVYFLLLLLFLLLLWRTQCCCYPLKVCCNYVCCCACCGWCGGRSSCCDPRAATRRMAKSAVNKYAVGVNVTKDGVVTMREVEREEMEAVKDLAVTAAEMAKPV